MSFRKWIKQYERQDSYFGDLADDINRDNKFPKSDNFSTLLNHLISKRACAECVQTFVEAYKEYIDFVAYRQMCESGIIEEEYED